MATYYVRSDSSDDSGTGTSTATSGANRAWKTLNKAYTTSTVTNGDIIYIAPGHYRETARVSINWTTTTAEIRVVGDPTATLVAWGSGVTAGPVIHSTFGTNDNTRNTGYGLLNLAGRDYITFENLYMAACGGNVTVDGSVTATSTNIKFLNCRIQTDSNAAVFADNSFGVSFNWEFNRCHVINRSSNPAVLFQSRLGSGSNYNVGVNIYSSVIHSGSDYGFKSYNAGSGAQGGVGGINIYNTLFMGYNGINANNGLTVAGYTVRNCTFFQLVGTALKADNTTLISEDYNRFVNCGTLRTIVNTGSNSNDGLDALDYGLMWTWGMNTLPYMPFPGGAADNGGTTNSGAAPTKDFYNRDFDSTPSIAPAEYGVISTGGGGGLLVHPGMTGRING